MATSTRAFLTELYEEYLEEASFLYEQRLSLLKNPEISWKKIGEFEQRFNAHIDGLVVGGDLALKVCMTRAKEGDFGELHAAMRVCCRHNQMDLACEILDDVDLCDKAKRRGIEDALKNDIPEAWFAELWHKGRTKPSLVPLLLRVVAYRGGHISEVGKMLHEAPPEFLLDVIWACGRLRQPGVCSELRTYLDHEDPMVQSQAATSLLRLGDDLTLSKCLRSTSSNWAAIPLGLAGSGSAVRAFLDGPASDSLNHDQVLALGLLGDIRSVPLLFNALRNSKTAEVAAISLQLMTGAYHAEAVFLPDAIDEDELFDEEREKLGKGQVPTRPDGEPFGRSVTRLSQKLEDWHAWWSEHSCSFDPQLRYRNGYPYSPRRLIEVLESDLSPHIVRALASDELVIRYEMDVRFESDMFVADQEPALERIRLWAEKDGNRFRDGCFYFAGAVTY
jgi:uncharacterized protein (TIGR02270 family)